MDTEKPLVIFVDDNVDYLDSCRALFPEYDVMTASTPEAAIAFARELTRPATLFLDLNLGVGLNGMQVNARMRANARFPLVTIYVSGDSSPETQAKAIASGGALVCLTKPVSSLLIDAYVQTVTPEQALLVRNANIDSLTGICNRKGFHVIASQELRHAIRNNSRTACIFIDVNDFGKFNDEHGYTVGDSVLKAIADSIRADINVVRNVDVFGRWGGDEFAILLPDTNVEQAEHIADRIKDSVVRIHLTDKNGRPIEVSVTTGIGSIHAQKIKIEYSQTIEELIAISSEEMKKRKRPRRNK